MSTQLATQSTTQAEYLNVLIQAQLAQHRGLLKKIALDNHMLLQQVPQLQSELIADAELGEGTDFVELANSWTNALKSLQLYLQKLNSANVEHPDIADLVNYGNSLLEDMSFHNVYDLITKFDKKISDFYIDQRQRLQAKREEERLLAEQARRAEEQKREEERLLAEQARRAEAQKREEERLLAEQERRAEAQKREEERLLVEKLALQEKFLQEHQIRIKQQLILKRRKNIENGGGFFVVGCTVLIGLGGFAWAFTGNNGFFSKLGIILIATPINCLIVYYGMSFFVSIISKLILFFVED